MTIDCSDIPGLWKCVGRVWVESKRECGALGKPRSCLWFCFCPWNVKGLGNTYVEATVVLLGANTTTGGWVEKTHVGGSGGNQGDEKDEDCGELHVDVC